MPVRRGGGIFVSPSKRRNRLQKKQTDSGRGGTRGQDKIMAIKSVQICGPGPTPLEMLSQGEVGETRTRCWGVFYTLYLSGENIIPSGTTPVNVQLPHVWGVFVELIL